MTEIVFNLNKPLIMKDYLVQFSPNTFKGAVAIRNETTGEVTILLDPAFEGKPNGAFIFLGGNSQDGYLVVRDQNENPTIVLDGKSGDLTVRHRIGGAPEKVLNFSASTAALSIGGKGQDGDIWVNDDKGENNIHIDGDGSIYIQPGTAKLPVVTLADQNSTGTILLGGKGSIYLYAATSQIIINNSSNDRTIEMDGEASDIRVKRRIGENLRDALWFDGSHAALYIGSGGNEGDLIIRDSQGRDILHIDGANASLSLGAHGNAGEVIVRDNGGRERIRLDGNTGDIRLQGADIAEQFEIETPDIVSPGMVLVIGDGGKLQACDQAYDRRVAGVLSGAGTSKPGIVLGDRTGRRNSMPVALSGTAYCLVDAKFGAIEVGDLLTTSTTKGYAMKASDPAKSYGALLGKALQSQLTGEGVIPILVSLQ